MVVLIGAIVLLNVHCNSHKNDSVRVGYRTTPANQPQGQSLNKKVVSLGTVNYSPCSERQVK